jgi:site-specific DNA-cytosine methylase
MARPKQYLDKAEKQKAYRQRRKLKGNETLRLEQAEMPMRKTILSLCDYTGTWSKPYRDAGYDVIQVDIKHGQDIRLFKFPSCSIHGVLAAPPCTHFAISGARHWKDKGDQALIDGLALVDACLRIITVTRPKWWVLENPKGRLRDYLGEPVMRFQPCDYGDTWTKHTCLWGEFNPNLRFDRVEPTQGSLVLNMPGHGEKRRAARSITPEGFAMAFFLANP